MVSWCFALFVVIDVINLTAIAFMSPGFMWPVVNFYNKPSNSVCD